MNGEWGERSWIADGWGFGFGMAIGYGLASVGLQIEWAPARWFLVIAGTVFGSIILVAFLAHLVSHGADKLMTLYETQLRVEAQYAKPEAEPEPPAPRVSFPPVSFCEFIWTWREQMGRFPTVKECKPNTGSDALAQIRYKQLVAAGALINRVEGQNTGEPAPGWDRARYVEMAKRDNTWDAT